MRLAPALPTTRGFTLIEIIIVVLVFSIMALMAYGGLNKVVDHSQHIEKVAGRSADLQRAYFRLRNDFQNLRDRPMRDAYGDPQPTVFVDADGGLNFVRGGWRNPLGSGRSSLERVRYAFDEGAVTRESWRSIDLIQDSEPDKLTLINNVQDLELRFMDAAGQWREEWPPGALPGASASAANDPPPIAVELTINTADWGEIELLFRTPAASLAPRGDSSSGTASASGPAPKLITQAGLLPGAAAGAVGVGTTAGQGAASDDNADDEDGQTVDTSPNVDLDGTDAPLAPTPTGELP